MIERDSSNDPEMLEAVREAERILKEAKIGVCNSSEYEPEEAESQIEIDQEEELTALQSAQERLPERFRDLARGCIKSGVITSLCFGVTTFAGSCAFAHLGNQEHSFLLREPGIVYLTANGFISGFLGGSLSSLALRIKRRYDQSNNYR
jgi:hypothetical protein